MKLYQKSWCSYMVHRSVSRGPRSCFRKKARGNKTSSRNRTRGVTVVWVAFMLFVLVLVAGVGLDQARLYNDAHQLQNAVDAAALAGAQYVKVGYLDAVDGNPNNQYTYPAVVYHTAREFANQHVVRATHTAVNLFVQDESAFDETADVVIGHYRMYTRQFTPFDPDDSEAKAPNAVKVVGRQRQRADGLANPPVPLFFGSIAGVDTANVVRSAIAISRGGTGAGLICLDEYPEPKPTGLQLGGGSIIRVNNGDVQVNSWSVDHPWWALRSGGDFTLQAEEMKVVGGTSPAPDDPFWGTQDYDLYAYTEDPLPDPLRHVPALWSPDLPTGTPPSPPGYMPLPSYGMAVQTDGTGEPLIDPETGGYISATYWDEETQEEIALDVTSPEPIDGSTIRDYGQDVGGVQTLTLTPGYYPGGLRLTGPDSGGKKFKLLPGVYAVGGGDGSGGDSGLLIHGGIFEARGVMIYATAAPETDGGRWAKVDLNGGDVTIHEALDPENWENEPYTDPDYTGSDYKFVAIFQDRDNPQVAQINGNTQLDLKGTLYFPTAHLELQGTGIEAGTQLIAGSIETFGNTEMTINYDGRLFSAGLKSLLVE